jgi:5-methylcytosine-specific restriction endonuclease McrA
MADSVSAALRRQVAQRACYRCEYCLIPEGELFAGCEVDHVISRKHGGVTDSANLAFSCERCNRAKGTDVGSLVGDRFVRLFNPRIDHWQDHFRLVAALIEPLTEIGQVTIRVLRFNAPDRLLQRTVLQKVNLYPIS